MKSIRALPLALALLAPAAHAQYAYDYAPLTGDPTLDAVLQTINALFAEEPDYYVEQIVYETQAPPVYVREYIVERRYAPADVYMIGELSQLSGRSFDDVAKLFDANRRTGQAQGRGWGAVARELGIKPGSAQFHQLKNGTTVFVDRGKAKRGKGHDRGTVIADRDRHGQVRERGRGAVEVQGQPRDKGQGKGKEKGKGKGKGKGKN